MKDSPNVNFSIIDFFAAHNFHTKINYWAFIVYTRGVLSRHRHSSMHKCPISMIINKWHPTNGSQSHNFRTFFLSLNFSHDWHAHEFSIRYDQSPELKWVEKRLESKFHVESFQSNWKMMWKAAWHSLSPSLTSLSVRHYLKKLFSTLVVARKSIFMLIFMYNKPYNLRLLGGAFEAPLIKLLRDNFMPSNAVSIFISRYCFSKWP